VGLDRPDGGNPAPRLVSELRPAGGFPDPVSKRLLASASEMQPARRVPYVPGHPPDVSNKAGKSI